MIQVTTRSLDKTAFFLVFGGKLVEIQDKYPNNNFVVSMPEWVSWYERVGGWVPYNHFCNVRREIKRKSRKRAGLPEYFTGNISTGFKLGDVATARPWSKRELERMNHER